MTAEAISYTALSRMGGKVATAADVSEPGARRAVGRWAAALLLVSISSTRWLTVCWASGPTVPCATPAARAWWQSSLLSADHSLV